MARRPDEVIARFGPVRFSQIGWRPPLYEYDCPGCDRPAASHVSSHRATLEAWAKAHAEIEHGVEAEPAWISPMEYRRNVLGQWTDNDGPLTDEELGRPGR